MVYDYGNFDGWVKEFGVGKVTSGGGTFENDDIESLKVVGGSNCCAKLWQHGIGSGMSAEFPEGEYTG